MGAPSVSRVMDLSLDRHRHLSSIDTLPMGEAEASVDTSTRKVRQYIGSVPLISAGYTSNGLPVL